MTTADDTLKDFQNYIQSMRESSLARVAEARTKMEEEQVVLRILNEIDAYLIYLKAEEQQREKKPS